MFQVKSNDEIGAYFAQLVDKSSYKSMRQFGRACLKQKNREPGYEPSEDDMKNMSIRLGQIKKGRQGITVRDLPIFTHLLGVTCEELLSAGEYIVPSAAYMTVRQFAASREQAEWETFLNREDKAFLNCDEFGKNAIEYALEFKNYDLLKYLMEKGIIWFVDMDPENYILNFGAGTSIKRRKPQDMDTLAYEMSDPDPDHDSDRLRRRMIRLAIEHRDLNMLEALKAREIPSMCELKAPGVNDGRLEQFRDDEMIRLIAKADDAVIDYFSREFTVRTKYGAPSDNTYIFPYLDRVAELMLEQDRPGTERVLTRCAEHNHRFLLHLECSIRKVQDKLAGMYEDGKDPRPTDEELYQQSLGRFFFFVRERMVTYYGKMSHEGEVTNLLLIESEGGDARFAPLIDRINHDFKKIMELTE